MVFVSTMYLDILPAPKVARLVNVFPKEEEATALLDRENILANASTHLRLQLNIIKTTATKVAVTQEFNPQRAILNLQQGQCSVRPPAVTVRT